MMARITNSALSISTTKAVIFAADGPDVISTTRSISYDINNVMQ
jgi:hypothetical protein